MSVVGVSGALILNALLKPRASVLKLNDGDQLKQSLLKNKEFIQYLLTNKKVEYLPEKIKKIIFF